MSELAIDYRKGNFTSSANRVSRAIDSRYNDYSGIRTRLNNFKTSNSYLSTAGGYLTKKLNKLEESNNKVNNFKNNVISFVEYANGVDKRIAGRISQNANDVYNQVGIKTGLIASCVRFFKNAWDWVKDIMSDVGEFFRNVKNEIVKFYNDKLKPIVDEIVECIKKMLPHLRPLWDLLALILSGIKLFADISSLNFLGIICDIKSFYDNSYNLVRDIAALVHHINGDDERAEEVHNTSARDCIDMAPKAPKWALWIYDSLTALQVIDFSKNLYTGIKDGLSVAQGGKTSEVLKSIFKNILGYKNKADVQSNISKLLISEDGKSLTYGILKGDWTFFENYFNFSNSISNIDVFKKLITGGNINSKIGILGKIDTATKWLTNKLRK